MRPWLRAASSGSSAPAIGRAEQAPAGVYTLAPIRRAGLDIVDYRLSRIRHLLWNGYHCEARRELFGLQHLAREAIFLNGERLGPPIGRFLARCAELGGYLANNETSLVDYSRRYRSGQPVSTSRAEGCIDEIANSRMATRQRMRWSPKGAHRVAVVRAAMLDRRLATQIERRTPA
jgi:hypothetical protein